MFANEVTVKFRPNSEVSFALVMPIAETASPAFSVTTPSVKLRVHAPAMTVAVPRYCTPSP